MHRILPLTLPLILVLSLACRSAAPSDATTGGAAAPRVARGPANLITEAEIEAAGDQIKNAYDLIEQLRPTMFRVRTVATYSGAQGNDQGIVVYTDDLRLGPVEQLRTVQRSTVREIRFISAADATTRWGTGHWNGVILVTRKQ